jgi:hypothetical protein
MISRRYNAAAGIYVAVAAIGLYAATPAVAKDIKFSGYTWHVRSDNGGPGPNNWSASNVWVDDQGRLHLKIAKRDGKWSCAEIWTDKRFGFGRYEFDVDTPVAHLDNSVVLGLFNYPTPDLGRDGTNEIDIEFATWGGQQKAHGNWTVWPAIPGVEHLSSPFDPHEGTGGSVNTFYWTPDYVSFDGRPVYRMLAGMPELPVHWGCHPVDPAKGVPQHPEPVHINLWLFNGKPPTDDKEVEVIISRFTFAPDKPDTNN